MKVMNENDDLKNDSQSENNVSKKDSEQNSWREVVMGGFSGIALGAVGVLFTGAKLPDSAPKQTTTPEPGESPLSPGIESASAITIATDVNDDMSFSEAFASARHEVGANGAFVWHGQVYTTCYAEEWNALSPEEQNAFSSNAIAATNGQQIQSHDHSDVITVYDPSVDQGDVADGVTIGVNVLGVETVVTEEGNVVNLGIAEMEGHDALFIDEDGDGVFDSMAIDGNNDGIIEDNEIMDVFDPNLNVETFNNATPTESCEDDFLDQNIDIN